MIVQNREYQQEAVFAVLSEPLYSRVILALAVGLGKSFTASLIQKELSKRLGRPARTLWLARQRQLIYQPVRYFPDNTVGMEMGKHTSDGEDIIFATAQSIHRRLHRFDPDEFDLVIADECGRGDVEVLTEDGFIRFDQLKNEKVAQVHDDRSIDFVTPTRKIKKEYRGDFVEITSGFDKIVMTGGHNQPLWNVVNERFEDHVLRDLVGYEFGESYIHSNRDDISLHSKYGEDTVYCVTVPTGRIVVRDGNFMIVTGNCQEAKGKQYEDVIKHFKPKYTVGLSGTPFRLDGKKLTDNLFDKIVYQKNIKWGIDNGFLCDVEAVRCYIDYDLSNVKTSGGDFNITDLEDAMTGTEDAIADAYREYSQDRPTLVFATGVAHAWAIAERIEGARVIVGDTKQEERDEIFEKFQSGDIPCLVSVQVMTQGVDLPISTVGIFAKPTKSVGRYQQQVGRILRTHPDKDKALIVDCIGSSSLGLCTAPSLIGINIDKVPEKRQGELEGDLMDLIELAEELSDVPTTWIRNHKIVDLWAKDNSYDTGKVNYLQLPDERMVVSLPERAKVVLPAPDMLGNIQARDIKGLAPDLWEWGLKYYGEVWEYQRALNAVKAYLVRNYGDSSSLWDLNKVKGWGSKPPTEGQMKLIKRRLKEETPEDMTRFEASQVINRLKNNKKK